MRWKRVAAILGASLIAVPAWAEAPLGFTDLPWGSSRKAVADFLQPRCLELRAVQGSVVCLGYSLGSLGDGWVALLFEPEDSLQGYYLTVDSAMWRAFRRTVVDKFGPPARTEQRRQTTEAGASVTQVQLSWSWPDGTTATLSETCGSLTESCLRVFTKRYTTKLNREDAAQREKARKAF